MKDYKRLMSSKQSISNLDYSDYYKYLHNLIIMNFLKKADSFGVIFNLGITNDMKEYKSAFGGFVTILVYVLSVIYFIYQMVLWQSKQILPVITNQDAAKTYAEANFTNSVSFQMSAFLYDPLFDPFNQTNSVLLCFFGYYKGEGLDSIDILLPQKNQNSGRSSILAPQNLTLVLNTGQQTRETPLRQQTGYLFYEVCDNNTANKFNITCATEDRINDFFKIPQRFDLEIHTKQYDMVDQKLKTVIKHIYYNIDPYVAFYGQIVYKITQQYIDDNLFIQELKHQIFVSDFSMINQPLSQKVIEANLLIAGFATFLIILDANQVEQYIQYPKLGDILANVGSIMSTLMSLSIIVQIVNSKLMEDQLFYDIISFYFPDYKKYKITKNLFGKITNIQLKDLQIDQNQFMKNFDVLRQKAEQKFSITNIIYEISRLQFLVQSIIEKENFLKCHQMGIKTQIPIQNQKNSQVVNFCDDRLRYDYDDFTILCQVNQEQLDIQQTSLIPDQINLQIQQKIVNIQSTSQEPYQNLKHPSQLESQQNKDQILLSSNLSSNKVQVEKQMGSEIRNQNKGPNQQISNNQQNYVKQNVKVVINKKK